MATDTHHPRARSSADRAPGSSWHGLRIPRWLRALGAGLGVVCCGLFCFLRRKDRAVPAVHEEVTLTPEGAEVWQQVMDPDSPLGKPVSHRRRRIPCDD